MENCQAVKKGEKIGAMVKSCRMAKKAGLLPHITIMFGYPWENEKQVQCTCEFEGVRKVSYDIIRNRR